MRRDEQPSLPGVEAPSADPRDDYQGVFPPKVTPTLVELVEQGESVLLIHRMLSKHHRPSGKQDQIWRLLSDSRRGYSNPDTPGSFAVVVVWGNIYTARTWTVYQDGLVNEFKGDTADYRAFLKAWFDDHNGRR